MNGEIHYPVLEMKVDDKPMGKAYDVKIWPDSLGLEAKVLMAEFTHPPFFRGKPTIQFFHEGELIYKGHTEAWLATYMRESSELVVELYLWEAV